MFSEYHLKTYFTLALISYVASKDELPDLDCGETLLAPLTIMPLSCTPDEIYTHIICEGRLDNTLDGKVARKVQVELLRVHLNDSETNDVNVNDSEKVISCIAIDTFSGTAQESDSNMDTKYHLTFNSSLSVGKMIFPRPNRKNKSMQNVFYVLLRTDVLELPHFAHSPDVPEFWNFSSPLLRAELHFLLRMTLNGFANKTYSSVLPGLQGCSLESINVDGYFGSDQRGPIPSFDHLPHLDYLRLSNSGRRDLPPASINGSLGINYLISDKNEFHGIPNVTARMRNLIHISITSNKGQLKLNPKLFKNLNNLSYLNFSSSRIQNWPIKFPLLPNLHTVSLSRCGLKFFDSTLLNFPALMFLDLSGNFLTSLSENAFSSFPKLIRLNLNENIISYISDHTFTNTYPLKYFSMSNNLLSTWPVFSSNSIFQSINLSNNNLTNIKNLGKLGDYALYLDISHNNIMNWNDSSIFINQRRRQVLLPLVFSAKRILMTSQNYENTKNNAITGNVSNMNRTKPWVVHLNISGNPIKTFSQEMLLSLNALESVDVGGTHIDCSDCQTALFQHWLNYTTIKIHVLGTTGTVLCALPDYLKGQPVENVEIEKMCTVSRHKFWWVLGSILFIVVSSILLMSGVVYFYRTEVVYLLHLAKVRANSRHKRDGEMDIYDAFVCYR